MPTIRRETGREDKTGQAAARGKIAMPRRTDREAVKISATVQNAGTRHNCVTAITKYTPLYNGVYKGVFCCSCNYARDCGGVGAIGSCSNSIVARLRCLSREIGRGTRRQGKRIKQARRTARADGRRETGSFRQQAQVETSGGAEKPENDSFRELPRAGRGTDRRKAILCDTWRTACACQSSGSRTRREVHAP